MQDADGRTIFQPYLAKFMCNVSDEDREGGGNDDGGDVAADRFVFYNVEEAERLKEETNFNETLPREVSRFISKEELGSQLNERDLVRAYAKTL